MQASETLNSLTPAPDPNTTAWRIWHDAAAGVWIDHFDGRWLIQTGKGSVPREILALAEGIARSVYWRPRDKAAATAPEHLSGERISERFLVKENGASYLIDFAAGYSCGIFLDQRLNRRRVGDSLGPGRRFLNTFAYTGGFSVMAARAGAITTTADLAKPYLEWTWENFAANGLDRKEHFGCRGDVFDWLRTFARQGRTFDGIVLDPPTFSRNRGQRFRVTEDYADLAALAAAVVTPGGWILACANTHGWPTEAFARDLRKGIEKAGRSVAHLDFLPMPPEFHGDDYLKSAWLVVG
jgi:23S rRNA (cytosine1962-C5)-methyltransferase